MLCRLIFEKHKRIFKKSGTNIVKFSWRFGQLSLIVTFQILPNSTQSKIKAGAPGIELKKVADWNEC